METSLYKNKSSISKIADVHEWNNNTKTMCVGSGVECEYKRYKQRGEILNFGLSREKEQIYKLYTNNIQE